MVDIIEFKNGLKEFAIFATDKVIEDLFKEYSKDGLKLNFVEFSYKVTESETANTFDGLHEKIKNAINSNPNALVSISEGYSFNGLLNPADFHEILNEFLNEKINSWDIEALTQNVEKVGGKIVLQDFIDKFCTIRKPSKRNVVAKNSQLPQMSPISWRLSSPSLTDQSIPELDSTQIVPKLSLPNRQLATPLNFKSPIRARSGHISPSLRPGTAQFTPKFRPESVRRPATASYESVASLQRTMLRHFLGLDFNREGWVSVQDFRTVMQQHGSCGISPQTYLDLIVSKSDIEEDGRINYMNFLRHFKELLLSSTHIEQSLPPQSLSNHNSSLKF